MSKSIVTVLKLDSKKFETGMSSAQKTILSFSGAVTAAGAAALAAAKMTANFQDNMIKTARAAGTTAESFSVLAHGAKMSGVSTDLVAKSMAKLNTMTPALEKSMGELGVKVRDVNGNLKNGDRLIKDVANAMQNAKTPAQQTAIAVKAFGEEGSKMVSMLKDGEAGLKAFANEAAALGMVVSKEAGEAAEKFNDDIARTNMAVQGLTMAIGESIIQFMNQSGVMDTVREAIMGVTKWWRELGEGTKEIIVGIGAAVVGIAAFIAGLMGVVAIAPMVSTAITFMTGGLSLLGVAIAAVIAALGAFVAVSIKYWGQIKEVIVPVTDSVKAFAKEIRDFLMPAFTAISGAVSNAWAKLKDFLGITENTTGEISTMGSVAKVTFAAIATFGTVLIGVYKVVFDIIKNTVVAIANAGKSIGQFVTGNFTEAAESARTAGAAISSIGTDIARRAGEVQSDIRKIWATPMTVKVDTKQLTKAREEMKAASSAASGQLRPALTETEKAVHPLVQATRNFISTLNDQKASIADVVESFGSMVGAYADVAKGIAGFASNLADTIAQGSQYAAEVQLRDLEVVSAKSEQAYNERLRQIESAYDAQINALRSGENSKTAVIEMAMNERLLLLNDEYQKARDASQKAFEAEMEIERANFEARKQFLLEQSYDKEQRMIVEDQMDADYKAFQEMKQREQDARLNEMAKEFASGQKEVDSEFKAELKLAKEEESQAIAALEEEKNNKLDELNKKRTEEEKAEEKKRLEIQYNAQLQQFEQTKVTKTAETMASGIAAAAMAFGSMAKLGPIGIGIGAALAATVLATTYMRVNQINQQRPIKPAGLMLEQGGVMGGNRTHARGGIPAEIESGEAVIDRARTRQLFDAIDTGNMGKTINITFAQGAISGVNLDSEEAAQRMSELIGQTLIRKGIAA
jgi:hypothetical protein